MNYVIAVWVGAAVITIIALILEDNIKRMPEGIQMWWKRQICDTEENLWPSRTGDPELLAVVYPHNGAYVAVLHVFCNNPDSCVPGSYQVAEEIPCVDEASARTIVDLWVETRGAVAG